jgi:hypothetical protein
MSWYGKHVGDFKQVAGQLILTVCSPCFLASFLRPFSRVSLVGVLRASMLFNANKGLRRTLTTVCARLWWSGTEPFPQARRAPGRGAYLGKIAESGPRRRLTIRSR